MRILGSALTLLLWLVSPFAAQDALAQRCGDAATLLGDERDLAAFRDAAELACPCEEYDGSAGRGVSDYRGCARAVLDEALVAGAIRRDCVADAIAIVEGAACGGGGVPCVRRSGRAPTCEVRPESQCRTRSGAGRLARSGSPLAGVGASRRPALRFGATTGQESCPASLACTDVLEWGAGTCIDVREDGPYGRGVHFVTLRKPSIADPSAERSIAVAVWYPIEKDRAASDPVQPVENAPPDLSGGPYPVVMFSHGSCGYKEQSIFLTPYLASHGFVVVAPDHTGNTIADLPACGTPPVQALSFLERPEDIRFALDWALGQSATPGNLLSGALDAGRIGMMGHSFGGLTTYLVAERDPRIRAAAPLAAAVPGEPVLTVPSLTMLGEIDSVVSNARIREAYDLALPPKLLVSIGDAGHYAFSDACFPSADCDPPRTRSQPEAHALARRWILPFFKVHLAGDLRFAPFLASDRPAGAAVTRR